MDHPAANVDQTARLTLTRPVLLTSIGDGFPFGAGCYHFLMPDPSTPPCRASPRPAASSPEYSPARASSVDRHWPLPTAKLRSPLGERGRTDAVTAAHLRHRHSSLLLLQYRNDLLFAKTASLHFRPTPLRRTQPKTGHMSEEHFRDAPRVLVMLERVGALQRTVSST